MADRPRLKNFDTSNSTFQKSSKSGQLIVEHTELDERVPVKLVRDTLIREYNFFVNNGNLPKTKPKNQRSPPRSTEDMINLELANMEDPITETIVTMPECNSCDFFIDVPKNILYSDEKDRMFRKMKERLNKEESSECSEYFGEDGATIFHLTSLCPKTQAQYIVRKGLLEVAYVPPFMKELSDAVMGKPKLKDEISLIDIQFNAFKFKHHYLYTLEHVLAHCLQETYAEYENRNSMNILKKLEDHLRINRNARDKVLKELTKLQKSKNQIYIDSTLLKYDKAINELKERYYLERKKDDEIVTKIILLWDDIRKVRRESSVVNSSVIVEIFKENISEEEINKAWDEMYNSEFMDELYHIEHVFAKELSEYMKRKHNNKNSESEKPSLNIDEDEIKQRVEERLNVLIPKGPKVTLNLKFDEYLITREVSDRREIERSRKISNTTYNFRVFVDESIVCESDNFRLNNNFCANLSDAFSIQILPTNKCIKISIMENEVVISNIKIDINNIKQNSVKQEIFNTKAKIEANDYTVGSGNNLQDMCKKMNIVLQSSNKIKDKFYTKGEISLTLAWSDHMDGNKMTDDKVYIDITKKIKNCLSFNTKLDFDMLSYIIANISVTREELNTYMAIYDECKDTLDNKWISDKNVIHEVDKTTNNARYKLLNYRESEKFINLKNSIIPLHSSQISTEQMQCLVNKTGISDQYYIPEEYHNMDMEPLALQRYFGAKYIQIINTHIQQNLHASMLEKSYDDVVQDNQATNPRMIISKINNRNIGASKLSNTMYRRSSSSHLLQITILRGFCLPDRVNVSEVTTSPRNENEGFIIKQLRPIVRVTHRDNVEQTSTAIGCNPSWNQTLHLSIRSCTTSVVNINIYDEVKEDLTETYDSDEPQQNKVHYRISHKWLGYLQIPLVSILSVSKLQGPVKINIPPVILGYQNSTDSNLHHTLNEQILPMYKDAAFITLSATIGTHPQSHMNRTNSCLQNSEGFIFKHMNEFLLNYSKEFPSRTLSLTYLTTAGHQKCAILFLQALPLPDLDLLQKDLRTYMRRESAMSKSSSSSGVRSGEGEGRRNAPDERVDSVNAPHSSELGVGERDSTQNTLDSRSLRKEGNQLDNVIHVCARYVSLIPIYEVSQTYQVTLMGWELVKILHGSPLDHTILLASYLLYLGVKCWIVCGMGLPRGFSSYVLIKYDILAKRILLTTDNESRSQHFYTTKQDNLVPYIYDAVSGTKYCLRDACCPLKTVHYVYNDENIWINIQFTESCDSARLDFTRTSDWQPVFNKNINLSKLPTISEHNLYATPENVDSLRERIENKIKAKVQKWRSHRRTIWNRYCSSVLKETLSSWEYWAFNPNSPKPAPSNRLKQLMSTYKIYGFPLNLPYTNMKRILSLIKSTTLFLNEEPFVEFGLSVEIYSYPGAVCSVWIYMASITRT